VDLGGKPWAVVPIQTSEPPMLYPLKRDRLYYNLGCYCWTRRADMKEAFAFTKLLDAKCFELGGLKMLYSSSFMSRDTFECLYGGGAYLAMKKKYDPRGRFADLYDKVVFRSEEHGGG
jgi:hypothetical protein